MTKVDPSLRPTLWRTCRVLANRLRIRILLLLLRRPDRSVAEVAASLGIGRPAASQYLRALNARGLLRADRAGRSVRYRLGADPAVAPARVLLDAVRHALERGRQPERTLFRLATAFTHLRRIHIYRALAAGPLDAGELAGVTGVSRQALQRHLAKLRNRGFVERAADGWRRRPLHGRLPRTLSRLADAG
jgi:DNA-binding transcriptional ArsR family regulator